MILWKGKFSVVEMLLPALYVHDISNADTDNLKDAIRSKCF
jgi:hypothetical protein